MDASVSSVKLKKIDFFEKLFERLVGRMFLRRALKKVSKTQLAKVAALQEFAADLFLNVTTFEAIQYVCGTNQTLNSFQFDLERTPSSHVRKVIKERGKLNDDFFRETLMRPLISYKMDSRKALWARMYAAGIKAVHLMRREATDPSCWLEKSWRDGNLCLPLDEWNTLRDEARIAQALHAAANDGALRYSGFPDGSLEWLRRARDWALLVQPDGHPMPDDDRRFVTETIDEVFMRLVPGYADARSRRCDKVLDYWDLRHFRFSELERRIGWDQQFKVLTSRDTHDLDASAMRRYIATIDEQDPGLAREFILTHMLSTWEEINAERLPESAGWYFAKKLASTPQQREDLLVAFDAIGGSAKMLASMLEIFAAQGMRRHGPMVDEWAEFADNALDRELGSSQGANSVPAFRRHFAEMYL